MASTATITDLVSQVVRVASVGYVIYQQTAKFMDSMQKSKESGQSKKDWVMTKMKEIIMSEDNSKGAWAEWGSKLSEFIDSIKSVWNLITGRK